MGISSSVSGLSKPVVMITETSGIGMTRPGKSRSRKMITVQKLLRETGRTWLANSQRTFSGKLLLMY